jgi:hypothetical protein
VCWRQNTNSLGGRRCRRGYCAEGGKVRSRRLDLVAGRLRAHQRLRRSRCHASLFSVFARRPLAAIATESIARPATTIVAVAPRCFSAGRVALLTALSRFADHFGLSSLSGLIAGARTVFRATVAAVFTALDTFTAFGTWSALVAASAAHAALSMLSTFGTVTVDRVVQPIGAAIARRIHIAIASISTVVAIRAVSTLATSARRALGWRCANFARK